MVDQTDTTPHIPHLHIDTDAIASRLVTLGGLQRCPRCDVAVTEAMADIAALMVEVARLQAVLIEARRESASRLAAIRAALGAASDEETDPLEYLRGELAESPGAPSTTQGRGWCE